MSEKTPSKRKEHYDAQFSTALSWGTDLLRLSDDSVDAPPRGEYAFGNEPEQSAIHPIIPVTDDRPHITPPRGGLQVNDRNYGSNTKYKKPS